MSFCPLAMLSLAACQARRNLFIISLSLKYTSKAVEGGISTVTMCFEE